MTDGIILDDGVYFVQLNGNYKPSAAPGFLQRRISLKEGCLCVGAFSQQQDGTWSADIQIQMNEATGQECEVVTCEDTRLGAICELWRNRTRSYPQYS